MSFLVVVGHLLPSDQLAKIAHVGQSVEVSYAGELLVREYRLLRDRPPGSESELEQLKGQLDTLFARAEVLFGPARPYGNLAPRLQETASPRLRWLQVTAAGVDQLQPTGLLQRPVAITTGRGLRSLSMAEYALWAMMTLNRDMLQRFRQQSQKLWHPRGAPIHTLQGQTLGVVGLGAVGSIAARLAKAFGMRVIATRRSATRRERDVDGVDEMFPKEELLDLLAQSDFVLLSLPYTPETRRLIGERELQAMRPTAGLINVSRGGVVDQEALVMALKEGLIRGAALDVFTPEPLPPESELWDLTNVVITPHISAEAGDATEAAVELFCQNLKRYLAGEPLVNVFDRELGY